MDGRTAGQSMSDESEGEIERPASWTPEVRLNYYHNALVSATNAIKSFPTGRLGVVVVVVVVPARVVVS